MTDLDLGSPYEAYLYAYPHKSAYRPFDPPRPLAGLWVEEDRSRLFLYVHVPFCAVRCGFCNLLTEVGPAAGAPATYVDAVLRQAGVVADSLGTHQVVQAAIGGGTPTFLDPPLLDRLLGGLRLGAVPLSVEASPDTVDDGRVAVLVDHRVTRVSLGVQSFDDTEARALGRPQRRAAVEAALGRLRPGPWRLNLDLMYGGAGQTPASFVASIDAALAWSPEEVYLYPLYVRPLTGLGRSGRSWDDDRLACYRAGRDRLLAEGYEQRSMRSFALPVGAAGADPLAWCCQDDGMVGLGAGARSYTAAVHWSTEYAVAQAAVRAIVQAFAGQPDESFALAHVGVDLDGDEQRRRFVVKSILRTDGLDLAAYEARFASSPLADLPLLDRLVDSGHLTARDGRLVPTERGLEQSDALGPALVSSSMQARSAAAVVR